ncbi:hypothetical protein CDAR_427951, partial [Caerostris darwini]
EEKTRGCLELTSQKDFRPIKMVLFKTLKTAFSGCRSTLYEHHHDIGLKV